MAAGHHGHHVGKHAGLRMVLRENVIQMRAFVVIEIARARLLRINDYRVSFIML